MFSGMDEEADTKAVSVHENAVEDIFVANSGDETSSTKRSILKFLEEPAFSYLLGGAIFLCGSIFYLPIFFDQDNGRLGTILFVIGSVLYLFLSSHDLWVSVRKSGTTGSSHNHASPAISIFSHTIRSGGELYYTIGSLFFVIGSLAFLPELSHYRLASWCFVWGSMLFVVGSTLDAIQQAISPSNKKKKRVVPELLRALSYLLGSTLFVVASIPYMFDYKSSDDRTLIYQFLSGQYIAGSLFFLVGGGIHCYIGLQPDVADVDVTEARS